MTLFKSFTDENCILQASENHYDGNAFVYVLASKIDHKICKIGKGNPIIRCEYWNKKSQHGGPLNNNLSVFAAYRFKTDKEAYKCESKAKAIYNFAKLNSDIDVGENEFFAVPPQQAAATLEILSQYFLMQQKYLHTRDAVYVAERSAAKAIEDCKTYEALIHEAKLNSIESKKTIANKRIEKFLSIPIYQNDRWFAMLKKIEDEASQWIDLGLRKEEFLNDPIRTEDSIRWFFEEVEHRKRERVQAVQSVANLS